MDENPINCCYFTLIGSIVSQAMHDYRYIRFERNKSICESKKRLIYKDAKDFLFTNRLQEFFEFYGVYDLININEIRKEALKYNILNRTTNND